MPVLSVHNLTMTYIEHNLFTNVSFNIEPHDKVGFIGANGVGKTTIFRIIDGEVTPTSGLVSISKDTKVGYMQQHACTHPDRCIYDEVLSVFDYLKEMQLEIDELSKRIENGESNLDEIIARQTMLIERFEREGGLTYKSRARSALIGLGFTDEDFSKPTGTLSGGQMSKLSLCKLLLSKANLLLLDEPTNHLDINSVSWLEGFLKDFKGEIIIISHDRYFLDAVTNKTIELEHNKITTYEGNYSTFIKKKEHELEALENKYKNDMREIKRIEGIIEQQKRWGRERNFITAQSKQHQLDKIKDQIVTPDSELETLSFTLTPKRESGQDVLMCYDLSKSFDDKKIFDNLSMHLKKGERVFIIGPNGCGKSTLFKLLTSQIKADSGEIRFGAKVDISYFDQMQKDLDLEKTALDEVYDAYPKLDLTTVRTMLGSFMFKGDDVFKKLNKMSGGERARVSLLKLMLKQGNLLLLDEPTNHLDTSSREALEKTLKSYGGTMLIISHDRYFINKLASRVLYMNKDGFTEYLGNYDNYLERTQNADSGEEVAVEKSENTPKFNDYQLQKQLKSEERKRKTQLKKCEERIAELEEEIESLHAQMSDESVMSDYEKLSEITSLLETNQAELDELYEKWAELCE
ncbi:MAG: ABC-F family ATP-binding cassette domain-containing protein [Ruminococcaceae bacterium]|nr:ABC-F family ATP-binding cassette domain-containing protein [Oscillospiraceae bacterium]